MEGCELLAEFIWKIKFDFFLRDLYLSQHGTLVKDNYQ